MKTKTQNSKAGLQNRPEQLSTNTGSRPEINFELRKQNRSLDKDSLLALMRSKAPSFYAVAEVVGNWVWIQFDGKQPSQITRALAELGFHWNNTRQSWQHPCGTLPVAGANYDPRKRYGSYFAADAKPA
jgi:hypothetical protein